MWSRLLKLASFILVGVLPHLHVGPTKSLLLAAPLSARSAHVNSGWPTRFRTKVGACFSATRRENPKLRLASKGRHAFKPRMSPRLTPVVATLRGGSTAIFVGVLAAVFMSVQARENALLGQKMKKTDAEITHLRQEITRLRKQEPAYRDAATETPGLSQETTSSLPEIRTLFSWTKSSTSRKGETISGCDDRIVDVRGSCDHSRGGRRSATSDVIVINRLKQGDNGENEVTKKAEKEKTNDKEQWLAGTENTGLDLSLSHLQSTVTEVAATMKSITKRGCNAVSLIANNGLGVNVKTRQTLASEVEDFVNDKIDEGASVTTECLRDVGKRVVALVDLPKEQSAITETAVVMKNLTKHGCTLFAKDGLGMEAGMRQALASHVEKFANDKIDEGTQVAAEYLWSLHEFVSALVDSPKQEKLE